MGDYVFTHLAKHKTPVDFLGIDFRYSRGHHDMAISVCVFLYY